MSLNKTNKFNKKKLMKNWRIKYKELKSYNIYIKRIGRAIMSKNVLSKEIVA